MFQVPERPTAQTVKLCDSCQSRYAESFHVKRLRAIGGIFKCDGHKKTASVGAVCEITAKKKAGKT